VKYTGTAAPAYGSASSYPIGAPRNYYLSGAGDLFTTPDAVKSGSVSWSNPGWALSALTRRCQVWRARSRPAACPEHDHAL
jgi:hypothetical protein